jgi:hypothetical protein
MSKKSIVPDPWGVPDRRSLPSEWEERSDLPRLPKAPELSQELRCTFCTYRINEINYLVFSACVDAMRQLAEACSKKGAVITYPTPYVMRVEVDDKKWEVSFTPDDPVTLTQMLIRVAEFLGD